MKNKKQKSPSCNYNKFLEEYKTLSKEELIKKEQCEMYEYNINKPLPNNIISILSVIISVFTLAVSALKDLKTSWFIAMIVISIIALILILVVFGISLYCTINSNKKSRVQYAEYELKKSIIDNLLNEIEKNETPQNKILSTY